MTMPRYKSGESMMTAAYYESGKSIIRSLIIIKIRFICFEEDEVGGLFVRLRAKSYNHAFFSVPAKSLLAKINVSSVCICTMPNKLEF